MLLSAPTQLLPRMIPCIIRLMSFISWIMNSKRVNGFKITRLTSTNNNQKNKMNLSKVPFKSASFIRIKVRPRNIAVSFCCEGRGELFILFKNFIPFFLCSKWFLGMQGGRTPFPAQRHAKTFQFLWLYVQLYRGGGNGWFCWKRELFLLATESELEFPEKLRFRFFRLSFSLLFNIHSTFESPFIVVDLSNTGGEGCFENSIVILCACHRHAPKEIAHCICGPAKSISQSTIYWKRQYCYWIYFLFFGQCFHLASCFEITISTWESHLKLSVF